MNRDHLDNLKINNLWALVALVRVNIRGSRIDLLERLFDHFEKYG